MTGVASSFKSESSKLWFAAAISYVNGWMDSICLRRYNCFATMMVGNQLTLGNAVGGYIFTDLQSESITLPDPIYYTTLILSFMLGVAFFRVFDNRFDFQPRHFGITVFVWIVAHDLAEAIIVSIHGAPNQWLALSLAPVFGIQDAIMTKGAFGFLPWCTTGNMVIVADGTVKQLLGTAMEQEIRKWKESVILLIFTISGAISGGVYASWHFYTWGAYYGDFGLMLVAPLIGSLFWMHDIITKPRASFSKRRLSTFVADRLLPADVTDRLLPVDPKHPISVRATAGSTL
jgi:uncharacterized membrane protein YoaK (UPF0700 family)